MEQEFLDTIFHECTQCGICCKTYQKVLLEGDEIERMKKLGANVGYMLSLNDLVQSKKKLNDLINAADEKKKIYMIHPDGKGCMFLEKRNEKYYCKIYHYRPKSCMGFKCNLADNSMDSLFMKDTMYLLGQDKFGREL